MDTDRTAALREMLEDIDVRLLTILEHPRPLEESTLARLAMLESARGAVLRLLTAAEIRKAPRASRRASAD